MAEKSYFRVENGRINRSDFNIDWGWPYTVNVNKMMEIAEKNGLKAIEISSKGKDEIGKRFSAMSLKYGDYELEKVYQSSKEYKNSGRHLELLECTPKEAKTITEDLKKKDKQIGIWYEGKMYPSLQNRFIYTLMYYDAVVQSVSLEDLDELSKYDVYMDIIFKWSKPGATQAESLAIVLYIYELYGMLPPLDAVKDVIKNTLRM